ncbi:histidinol-phosphate aminotransferase [Antarctobacter heliothermus]|uniref:Histidinol-phosphate aminotransferase n=1 Tax=Antarctobacter heliothermus TaxID=74033 RepID=A0A222E523_9RHOB|nr:histidinol-phosphate transaminase [Antarctobacter heliothermus]ASP21230.1 histidinol-phosphate aminotransferase [Antarctobacter heliothermus]
MTTTDAPIAPRPYVTGKTQTVVKPVVGIDVSKAVNLATNESVHGPATGVAEAVAAAGANVHRYADVGCRDMRAAISGHFGIEADRIICGNGSEEILDMAGRVYARPGDEILYPAHSFLQFSIVAYRIGATAVEAPLGPDFTVDVEALLAAVTPRTRIVFLANPNNPTGVPVPAADVRKLAARLRPDILLVLDCAYAEFADQEAADDAIHLARTFPNVLVTRTFSKAYGMAGLRCGWGYGPRVLIAALDNMRGIGNLNGPAQAAAAVAIQAQDHVQRVVEHAIEQREYLERRLAEAHFDVLRSATNFVFARIPRDSAISAADCVTVLAKNGYLIRANEDYGLPDHLRISVGHHSDMVRVADILASATRGNGRGEEALT